VSDASSTIDRLRSALFQGLIPITAAQVPAEIFAGLTLAAIAIPEVMGYTKISGTPVVTGLYTMLVPAILFAIFGSSRHLVVGADSATAAILAAGLIGLAPVGSDEYAAMAAMLAIMAAGFVLVARVIGLGFMADFLSRTVLIGFLTGVGVQVSLGQLSGMLGLEGGGHPTLVRMWNDLGQIDQVNFYALTLALCVIVVIAATKWFSEKIPGALIAVIGAIAPSWALGLDKHVHILGTVPNGLPHIGLPPIPLRWDLIEKLAPTAFSMFVVILAQSAATSRAYAARYRESFSENTDLVGLGLANIGAGLSGAFVVNGSPTKTQIVDSAGGRTQLSLLVTAALVLMVLMFLTVPLSYIPEAVLSAVVFVIGIEMIDLKGMRDILRKRRSEFWVALITASTVVVVGVEQGILLAIGLSLIDHTRRGYAPRNFVLAPGEDGEWLPSAWNSGVQAAPGLIIYHFSHSMYYANIERLTQQTMALVDDANPPVRWFCIDGSGVDDVDYTAAETIRSLHAVLKDKGVRLVITNVLGDAKATRSYHLRELFDEDAIYPSLGAVMRDYQGKMKMVDATRSGTV